MISLLFDANQIVAGFLTFINCYDVKFTTKLQNLFMFTKIAALVIVIIVGVVYMSYGKHAIFTANIPHSRGNRNEKASN